MAATNQGSQEARPTPYGGPAKEVRDEVDVLRSDIASLANSVSKLASEKLGTAVGDAQATAEAKLGDLEQAIRRTSADLCANPGHISRSSADCLRCSCYYGVLAIMGTFRYRIRRNSNCRIDHRAHNSP